MRKLTKKLVRKQGGLSDHLDMPHVFLFCTFVILSSSFFEFNKGLKCAKSPMKTILSSFNLSNKRITFLLSLLIVIYSFFLFFFSYSQYVTNTPT